MSEPLSALARWRASRVATAAASVAPLPSSVLSGPEALAAWRRQRIASTSTEGAAPTAVAHAPLDLDAHGYGTTTAADTESPAGVSLERAIQMPHPARSLAAFDATKRATQTAFGGSGVEDLSAWVRRSLSDGVATKYRNEEIASWKRYQSLCDRLRVPSLPWNVDALCAYMNEKCAKTGNAVSCTNWVSNLHTYATRELGAAALTGDQREALARWRKHMAKTYGVSHRRTTPLYLSQLDAATKEVTLRSDPVVFAMRVQAFFAHAFALRTNEHLLTDKKKPPITCDSILFIAASALHPRGAIRLTIWARKASVASGEDVDTPFVFYGEPVDDDYDFVKGLRELFEYYDLASKRSEPLFAKIDDTGARVVRDGCVVPMDAPTFNDVLARSMRKITEARITSRCIRVGKRSALAQANVDPAAAEVMMGHNVSSKRSANAAYIACDPGLMLATRGSGPLGWQPPRSGGE